MRVAGAATGAFARRRAGRRARGRRRGRRRLRLYGAARGTRPRRPPTSRRRCSRSGASRGKGKAFVDFQNDVTDADIELAAREGFRSVEHLKRYTTLGMATDQGKTSNVNGLAIMAELTGQTIPETGTTIFRPPYTPVAIGALAGHHRGKDFRPTRLTPTHDWAQEQGAVFVETGAWLRAQWYPQPGETDWLTTVNREVQAVRSGVGICDVSTLGKIDMQGADAGDVPRPRLHQQLVDAAVGKARYGLMLREDGFVMDDGTTSRLGRDAFPDDHHHGQCRQGDAASRILPSGAVARARRAAGLGLRAVGAGRDRRTEVARRAARRRRSRSTTSPTTAFPYLAARATSRCGGGIPARLFRISFSGELAYELAVPADYGDALMRDADGGRRAASASRPTAPRRSA